MPIVESTLNVTEKLISFFAHIFNGRHRHRQRATASRGDVLVSFAASFGERQLSLLISMPRWYLQNEHHSPAVFSRGGTKR